MGSKEERIHLIGGANVMNGTLFETRDLIDYFCHIESFSAKITEPSAEIWQKLFCY